MDTDEISDLIIVILVFLGTLSFAITSFGGDILFQLGISICSLSGTFCKGSLLTTLAMITLMAFIKLPIQILFLRRYINIDLALRLGIPMCIGTIIGLHFLTSVSNDLLLKRIFGYIIMVISLYHLVNDSIAYSNGNNSSNSNNRINNNNDNNINELMQNRNVENIIHINEDGIHKLYIPYSLKNNLHENNYDLEVDRFQINTTKKEIMVYFAGFSAGLLAGIYGTGGPPLMLLATHISIHKDEWRATCTATYFLQNLVTAAYISTFNEYRIKTEKQFLLTLGLVATVLVALYVGNLLADKVNPELWKKLILFLLMIGSGVMICSGYSLYVQFFTILMLIAIYGIVYCLTLKCLGIEILSSIRNRYYNIPAEESIPREGVELSEFNRVT